MIKKPFNFALGIFCGCCLAINIANQSNIFILTIAALATAVNITIGLIG